MDEIDEQDDRERMGLNDQGFGTVAMPPASGAAPLPGHRLQDLYGPMIPRADRQVQANPLTGILEAVPTQQAPMSPQQHDPWVAQQVQNLEKTIDLYQQNPNMSDWQKHYAIGRKQRQIAQIDPQGFYRRGGPASQLNNAQKWAAQNVFKDPNTGLIFYNDGRTWKHIEPKDTADYHQKLLDIREAQHKEVMAHREAQLNESQARHQMQIDAMKAYHEAQIKAVQSRIDTMKELGTTRAEQRKAEFESRHPEWKATEEAWRKEINNGITLFQKKDKLGNAVAPDADTVSQATEHAKAAHPDLWERFQRVQKERAEWEKKHAMPPEEKMPGADDAVPAPPSPEGVPAPPEPSDAAKAAAQEVLDKAKGRNKEFKLNSLPAGYHAPV